MKVFNTLLFLLAISFATSAQHPPHCGTDEFTEILINNNPELIEKYATAEAMIMDKAASISTQGEAQAPIYTIPVVVHVIYNSQYDNISRSQILDALRVLNEDFRRQNADAVNTRPIFQSIVADIEVEFVLAGIAPDGSCTDGINRIKSSQSVNARDNVKDLIQWDNDKYMNVWVVNSINSSGSAGTVLGYAYRPFIGQGYKQDGIVIRHDRMGTIGTGVSEGRTLTHETGHYLGLLHPFDDGCFQGDNIADTPPVANSSFGCDLNKNTCNNDSPDRPDMVENYMDYADDHCQNAFTQGQKNYMRATLETANLRRELRLQNNLQATGAINPPACQPTALIGASGRAICTGDTVQFFDETEDGTPATWTWHFPGGQPSVATNANPTVIYNSPGIYDVSLVVSNAAGSDSVFIEDHIKVRSYWTNYHAQWIEDFETPLNQPEVSVISNQDTAKFRITNLASSSGNQSLFLNNFNAQAPGAVDEFISPNIFTIFGESLNLNFDYAFAAQAGNNDDQLRVYVSDDCGETWDQRKIITGGAIRTTSTLHTNPFVPTANEWSSTFVPLSFYKDSGPILIKFEFTSGGGNNLYIDNINFSGSNVSLEENSLAMRVAVFPNPASEAIHLERSGPALNEMKVSLTDLYGKTVYEATFQKDEQKLTIQRNDLPTGVYLMKIAEGEESIIRKVLFR